MENSLYPASPVSVDAERLAISASFRNQVRKVIGSIFLFMIVYLILVAAAIVLAAGCCYLGVWIIIAMPKFITLILGLGLMAAGVSVFIFLVKFVATVAKDENSKRVEITEEEQPRLFAFIRRLTEETHTPFPRKIFVSPDVNACVFYNSSFWSMFLPVRKNLEIGLGLVNSINISEFKAVMAHEFGHFSQRSMKLGSFTYNVNRVIHNMLYENKGYTAFLQTWGNIHSYLSIFASLTVKIATGIQWILRGMYTIINKSYLGLSREMEFHADAVAASVSGGNNLVSALSRVEVAGSCYNTVLNEANERLKENKISGNIFSNQLTVLRSLAEEHRLPIRQGLPAISYHFIESFSRSRINYKDQWASHPTLGERKSHLDLLGIEVPADDTPVWDLFDQPESLQERITGNLYQSVNFKDPAEKYDARDFEQRYLSRKAGYTLPEHYKGFYDGRYIDIRDWDLDTPPTPPTLSFAELFNEETGQIQSLIKMNRTDLELVSAIKTKKINVSSFDFDGIKHTIKDCDAVIARLNTDLSGQLERQQSLDKEAFLFFYHRAGADKEGILRNYRRFKSLYIKYEEYVALVNRLLKRIQPFYTGGITLDEVRAIIQDIKSEFEPALKKAYREIQDLWIMTSEENKALSDRIADFNSKNYFYFVNNEFQNNELSELTSLAIQVAEELNRYEFNWYKKMLTEQAPGSESSIFRS